MRVNSVLDGSVEMFFDVPRPARLTGSFAHPIGRARGFTFVELSAVLIVIGLILGAVAVARDLHRNAQYQRLASDFVQGWQQAYDAYWNGVGRAPGDNPTSPTGAVAASPASSSANGTPLCDDDLLNTMLAAGIALPAGRSEGLNNRFVYLDANGNPQEARICFQSVRWAEPGTTVGTYVSQTRNVMVVQQLVPSLAQMLDSQIDGQADARFGRMREASQANAIAVTTGQVWSKDDRWKYADTTAPAQNFDESQVGVVTAWVLMSR